MNATPFSFFQMAVTGVIAPFPGGVARGCVECRASTRDPVKCNGFGPGCLVAPRRIELTGLR